MYCAIRHEIINVVWCVRSAHENGRAPAKIRRTSSGVLRGDIVKDDAGCQAILTERGTSASQMTAARVLDTFSRPAVITSEADDAVSAFSQVRMKGAPTLPKLPDFHF